MNENLNLTELIEQLQQIVKDGRFEYTPTNIESVKYTNYPGGSCVTLQGAASDADLADMQRDIDDAHDELRVAEREVEDLEQQLRDARERIVELKNELKASKTA